MFVGEAPGFHEDKQGYPFVGQAGKLLDKLLAGIGLTRDQVYIANVLKCRPPAIATDARRDRGLRGHLFRQIALIEPRLIATLGNFATKLLSGQQHGITQVHGEPQETASVGGPCDALPALPSGGSAVHAGDAPDARGGLCAHSRAHRRQARSAGREAPSFPSVRPSRPSHAPSSSGSSSRRRALAMIELESSSAEETERIAARLAALRLVGDVVVAAKSGAGRRRSSVARAAHSGSPSPVTSPTFTIGHRYGVGSSPPISTSTASRG